LGAAKELLGVVTGQTDRVFDAEQSEIYRANFKLFRGVVYSAVMEKRTCVVCAGYDGTIYWMEKVPKGEVGETFAEKPALPIHPNCRCAYVPFCKSWEELPIDDNEFSKSARKLLGGDIPKTRKWEEWFLSRTEGVQKKILGETRFNLWKARAVEIKDLSVGSKVVPLKDLIEAPKVAKKLKEIWDILKLFQLIRISQRYLNANSSFKKSTSNNTLCSTMGRTACIYTMGSA
jgi:hypothetical protein